MTEEPPADPPELVSPSASLRIFLGFVALLLPVTAVTGWFFGRPEGTTSQQQIAMLSGTAARVVLLSIVVGAAAMAVVEMGKRLLFLRGAFHLRQLGRRLGRDVVLRLANPFRLVEGLDRPPERPHLPEQPPSTGQVIMRLDVPLEQLVAQIGDHVEAVLNRLASRLAERSPFARDRDTISDHNLIAALCGPRGAGLYDAVLRPGDDPVPLAELRALTQLALDDIQATVGNTWRWAVRMAAAVSAAVIGLFAMLYVDIGPGVALATAGASFLFGGFFAQLSRDLAAVVERWREP